MLLELEVNFMSTPGVDTAKYNGCKFSPVSQPGSQENSIRIKINNNNKNTVNIKKYNKVKGCQNGKIFSRNRWHFWNTEILIRILKKHRWKKCGKDKGNKYELQIEENWGNIFWRLFLYFMVEINAFSGLKSTEQKLCYIYIFCSNL